MSNKPQGTFHDATTGKTITRDLTAEEVSQLPEFETPLSSEE